MILERPAYAGIERAFVGVQDALARDITEQSLTNWELIGDEIECRMTAEEYGRSPLRDAGILKR